MFEISHHILVYLTGACDVPVDSCACNNPCTNADTCQDLPQGGTQCVCDCTGNEECVTDRDTGAQECKCPLCYTNAPGETGCMTGKLLKASGSERVKLFFNDLNGQ